MVDLYEYAASKVIYNPLTGSMIWKPMNDDENGSKKWNTRFAWRECGGVKGRGYRSLSIRMDGKRHWIIVHRLAWFVVYGVIPDNEIDHINQNRVDNRIENLRHVTSLLNNKNKKKYKTNTSGVTGVVWEKKSKKWKAQASIKGRYRSLGVFDDIKTAEKAVKEYRAQHGFTEMHGC